MWRVYIFFLSAAELNEQSQKLRDKITSISEVIIQNLIGEAGGSLRQVGDTPRLYRRTNRAPPTAHQPYIATAVTTLSAFASDNVNKVDSKLMASWLTQVCTDVSEQ